MAQAGSNDRDSWQPTWARARAGCADRAASATAACKVAEAVQQAVLLTGPQVREARRAASAWKEGEGERGDGRRPAAIRIDSLAGGAVT
jgi:hypothetical protein